jgi:hypothetical protein
MHEACVSASHSADAEDLAPTGIARVPGEAFGPSPNQQNFVDDSGIK